jgi:HAD superfamily hydrolase (TIGR01484 family)
MRWRDDCNHPEKPTMRYHALAADYDGTLAHHGKLDGETWAALRQLRESGRKLVMVTGRELNELLALLPHPEVFDRIVAENGAVVYEPETKEISTVCPAPSADFVAELRRRGVDRLAVGRVIVASWEPHQDTILHVIHDLGLELQVIFNKGAVMVLPSGVNKATGLEAALVDLGLSKHNVVGIGDAENDHALLESCECGVAVANALPALKSHADLVTTRSHGKGVAELVDHLLEDDLAAVAPKLTRHFILLGKSEEDVIGIDPYASNVMVCGTSGSGKSTLTTGLLERLCRAGYQFAVVDPEGDYSALELAVVLGGSPRVPMVEEVVDVLREPHRNVVANMLGVAVEHRPEYFAQLLPAMSDLRTRTGRPHWLVIDEAHHLLPAAWEPLAELTLRPRGTLYVTVHPGSMAPAVLRTIDTFVATGEHPEQRLREFCKAAGVPCPRLGTIDRLPPGQALYWKVGTKHVRTLQTEPPKTERKRHSRKYIEGNLGSSHSFYFHGPDGKLNLKAHNLQMFMHLADGVDDGTWLYHLHNGDYSKWFRVDVKDKELAEQVQRIERDTTLKPAASRAAVRGAISKRYTLPVDSPSGLVDD